MSSVQLKYKDGTETTQKFQSNRAAANRKLGLVILVVTIALACSVIFYRSIFG